MALKISPRVPANRSLETVQRNLESVQRALKEREKRLVLHLITRLTVSHLDSLLQTGRICRRDPNGNGQDKTGLSVCPTRYSNHGRLEQGSSSRCECPVAALARF